MAYYNSNAPVGQVDPQLAQFFTAVDTDRSGRINAIELQSVLQSSNGRKFNETACRLMISLFDGGVGSIDISGFSQLYGYVNQWMSTFSSFDRNQSGFIDSGELGQALQTMGYRFTTTFIQFLSNKFGEGQSGLPVDGFIMVCILIHKFTEGFRKKDQTQQGVIQINYEEFLTLVMQSWT